MKLRSGQIQDVKKAIIKEVKELEYGTKSVNSYVTLTDLDLDLDYTLKVAPVVDSGLTLIAEIDSFEAFDFNGDSVEVENKELIKTITIKLW
jgi:hypothetical protein